MRALLMSDLPKIGALWLDGLDTSEIAERLKLAPSDVHNALPEARRRLRAPPRKLAKKPRPPNGLPRFVHRRGAKFVAQLSKPDTGQNPIYLGLFCTVEAAADAVARALAKRGAAE